MRDSKIPTYNPQFDRLKTICNKVYILLLTQENGFDLDSLERICCLRANTLEKIYRSMETVSLCHWIYHFLLRTIFRCSDYNETKGKFIQSSSQTEHKMQKKN